MLISIENMRQQAQRKLSFPPSLPVSERVDRCRKFLKLEQHRLLMAHRAGSGGRIVARARAQLVDSLIERIFDDATTLAHQQFPSHRSALSLIAIGGYGRGELAPFSDVDLLFLFEPDPSRHSKPSAAAVSLAAASPPVGRSGDLYVDCVVANTLYLLWDIGFKVGHATRTIRQSLSEARRELKSLTAMLDARLLAGDPDLFARLGAALHEKILRADAASYIAARLADLAERHSKHGNTVFLQEPNLKSGCGSLRDAQNMMWMTRVWLDAEPMSALIQKGWLTESERKGFEKAVDFLWRVRTELHYATGRATEILSLPLQSKIAAALGYPQRRPLERTEAFMRDYYSHSRRIALLTAAVSKRLAAECHLVVSRTPRGRVRARRAQSEPVRLDGLILRDGILEAENETHCLGDASRLMQVFLLAQQRQADLGPILRRQIREQLARLNNRFRRDPVVSQTFLTLLRHKGEVARILRLMHETDFLGRYIPEFGRLTCRVQHEFYHRYTADEHTLVAMEVLDRVIDATAPPYTAYKKLFQQLDRPHLLYLALLLHDTGKSKTNRGHAQFSAENARRVAQRLGLDADDAAILQKIVLHHLTMSQLSQRRDLDDPHTTESLATIAGNEPTLDMLQLLTFADGLALGGGVWNEWKNSLLWQLYQKTRLRLRGEPAQKQLEQRLKTLRARAWRQLGAEIPLEELDAHFELMPPAYFARTPSDEIAEHLRAVHQFLCQQADPNPMEGLRPVIRWRHFKPQGHSEVVVCTWDRPGLFAHIAGSLSLAGLNILSANIYTRADHVVVDSFDVSDARLGVATNEKSARLFEQTLSRACRGEALDFDARLASLPPLPATGWQESAIPTAIEISNDASQDRTVIEVQTEDKLGLLYRLCHTLTQLQLDITFAKISTEKGAAIDTFYVVGRSERGGKITDPQQIETIRAALTTAVRRRAPSHSATQ